MKTRIMYMSWDELIKFIRTAKILIVKITEVPYGDDLVYQVEVEDK